MENYIEDFIKIVKKLREEGFKDEKEISQIALSIIKLQQIEKHNLRRVGLTLRLADAYFKLFNKLVTNYTEYHTKQIEQDVKILKQIEQK